MCFVFGLDCSTEASWASLRWSEPWTDACAGYSRSCNMVFFFQLFPLSDFISRNFCCTKATHGLVRNLFLLWTSSDHLWAYNPIFSLQTTALVLRLSILQTQGSMLPVVFCTWAAKITSLSVQGEVLCGFDFPWGRVLWLDNANEYHKGPSNA